MGGLVGSSSVTFEVLDSSNHVGVGMVNRELETWEERTGLETWGGKVMKGGVRGCGDGLP